MGALERHRKVARLDKSALLEDNLPAVFDSETGAKILLRERARARLTIFSINPSCWNNLCVVTIDVVDGEAVHTIGSGESKSESKDGICAFVWHWMASLVAMPLPGNQCDAVTFEICNGTPEKVRRFGKSVKAAQTLLQKFDRVTVLPWREEFERLEAASDLMYQSFYRPELPWEVDGDE